MLAPSWVALFKQIPVALHDSLVLITVTGAEIMIQKILVLEQEYFVYRGRMSGVQDSGLVMMMPYDQISNLAFNRRMLEPEVRQIFSGAEFVASEPTAAAAAVPVSENAAEVPKPAAPAAPPARPGVPIEEPVVPQVMPAAATDELPASTESNGKPGQPSKSTLLARLRARLAGQTKS